MKAQTKRNAQRQLNGATEMADYIASQAKEIKQIYQNGDMTEKDLLEFIEIARANALSISNVVSDEMAKLGLNKFEGDDNRG